MSNADYWDERYDAADETLEKMRNVVSAATAFNTNIDAVVKISGARLAEIAGTLGIDWDCLSFPERSEILSPADVVKGAFRCFSKGIAEEWLVKDKAVFDWMQQHLGFDRMQMGGQGGIVANALAVCGVQKVVDHCNSLPKAQAEQFLKLDNLQSFDENGRLMPAYQIDRKEDVPLIHWIIEFDKGDVFDVGGHRVVCPKSNRFIATYDPLNFNLVTDANFVKYLDLHPVEVVVLSGYHALTSEGDGVRLVRDSLPLVKSWQEKGTLVHLEVASTQDTAVRKAIVDIIASQADSIGLNERETCDVLRVIDEGELADICDRNPSATNLFDAVLRIKKKVGCRRIQLHMFGLYLTIQDKGFPITPEQNLRGMCLAATVAASKAGTGHINEVRNLMWAKGIKPCEIGLRELDNLAGYAGSRALGDTGIGKYDAYDVIAVPTLLVEKPLTLVGMGDTISSISLIGALKA